MLTEPKYPKASMTTPSLVASRECTSRLKRPLLVTRQILIISGSLLNCSNAPGVYACVVRRQTIACVLSPRASA